MIRLCFLLLLLCSTFQSTARATLLIDLSGLGVHYRVIDFQQFAGQGYLFMNGPQQLGSNGIDVVFTATNPDLSVLGDGGYDLGVNGSWGSPYAYVAIDFDLLGGDAYSMIFHFANALDGVAALMNYRVPTQEQIDNGIGYQDVIIEALDANDLLLESYNLTQLAPISTPSTANAGAYRGIVRGAADIRALRISNSGAILTNLSFSSPDFPPISTGTPEPATFLVAVTGLLFLALARRRKVS